MIDKKIMITCPVADLSVPTGFRAPFGTDITGLKRVSMRHCPACGEEHIWDGEDGYWLEEAPPLPSFWQELLSRWRRPKMNSAETSKTAR